MVSSFRVSHIIVKRNHLTSFQFQNGRVGRVTRYYRFSKARLDDQALKIAMLSEPKRQTPTGPPKSPHDPRPATSSGPCHLSHTDPPLAPFDHTLIEPRKLEYRLIGGLRESLMMSHRFGHVWCEGVCAVDLGGSLDAC